MANIPILIMVPFMLAATLTAGAQQAGGSAGSGKSDSAKSSGAKDTAVAPSSSGNATLSDDTSAALYYPWAFADLRKVAEEVADNAAEAAGRTRLATGKTLLVNNAQEIRTDIELWRYFKTSSAQLCAGAGDLLARLEKLKQEVRKAPPSQEFAVTEAITAASQIVDLAKSAVAIFQSERSLSGGALPGTEAAYRDMVAAHLRAAGWGIYIPGIVSPDNEDRAREALSILDQLTTLRGQFVEWQSLGLPELRQDVASFKPEPSDKSARLARLDNAVKACDYWVQAIDSFIKVVGLDQPVGLQHLVQGAVCQGLPCLFLRLDVARGSTYTKKGAWSGTHLYAGDFLAASYELYDGAGLLVDAGVVTTNDVPQPDPKIVRLWVFHEVKLP